MRLTALGLVVLLLIGCDDPKDSPIQKGQSYVDQAREVSAADADQKVQLAQSLIQAGRLEDAKRLLDELESRNLPAETKEKLSQARRDLESAK